MDNRLIHGNHFHHSKLILLDKLKRLLLIALLIGLAWGQDTVTDIDGNEYETVEIGEQVWMAENLKVTHYNDGTEIPTGYSDDDWAGLSTGAYAVYDDNESNADTYGYLYNWYAVDDDREVCPASWHVPTDGEYTALSDYLGGTSVAGGKLKECTEGSCPESEYWYSPNTGATNESGFTALPGGARYYYRHMGYNGSFWSSTEYNSLNAWHRGLESNHSEISRRDYGKDSGFSVRCIRDETETGTILVLYNTGWNIVGLPLDVEDASYSILFPESIEGTLYSFNGAYDPATNLINGEGYWLRFNEAGSTTISGTPINELTISLNEGWNLISGISTPLDITEIQDPDGIMISGTVYGFSSGSYSNEEIIEPGKGYWIRANSSGSIILISE